MATGLGLWNLTEPLFGCRPVCFNINVWSEINEFKIGVLLT